MAAPPPSRIGRYRVERLLGQGAMGMIYLAHDPAIGRQVAIKLVRADLLDGANRATYLERFRHEARAAGRCAHPNIVAIYDFAEHEGNPFLAMEYIDGIALGDALASAGRFTPGQATAIIVQVLDALDAAHALGVIHRDVKPANILIARDGQAREARVKVTDFGISRINTSEMTMDGAVIGTPAYMSPEQCRGDSLDARGDLFSTGAVLHELLMGRRAFPGRTIVEITQQILNGEPAALPPGVPEGIVRVLRRAMEKNPEARFPSARAMADALRQAMGQTGDQIAGDQTVRQDGRPDGRPDGVARELIPVAQSVPLDDAALSTIERMLAQRIGPIARHLVRDAAKRTTSLETVCETVARGIDHPAERERFLAEVRGGTLSGTAALSSRPGMTSAGTVSRGGTAPSGGTSSSGGISSSGGTTGGLTDAQIERAVRALTLRIGPIAKVLVKRALPGAGSEAALWEKLAPHVENAADREAFLRQRSGG